MPPRTWAWNSPLAPPYPTALVIPLYESNPLGEPIEALQAYSVRELYRATAPRRLIPDVEGVMVFAVDPQLYWPDNPAGVRAAERYYAGRHHFLATDEAIDDLRHPHGWWLDDGTFR